MSQFVKNKAVCNESVDHTSAHGPNTSAKQESSKKTGMQDLNEDTNAQSRAGQCRYIKPDDSPCGAPTRRDSFYCFFHDPDRADEREAARIKGGKERSRKAAVLPEETPDRPLRNAADVMSVLGDTMNQVLRGQIAPGVAHAVNGLAASLIKAQQQDLVERRLEKLESLLLQKWANAKFASVPAPESAGFEFVKAKTGGEA